MTDLPQKAKAPPQPVPRRSPTPAPTRAVRPPEPETAPLAVKRRGRLVDKRVTLCVTGSIAAYKAVLLLRLLLKEGAQVEVILTRSAEQFVGAATFSGLTGKPVLSDMFAKDIAGELHVELAQRTDLLLVVPATADVLARFAAGRADDLLTALALCATCPILVAPAMHPSMWTHPATQRNIQALVADKRVGFVGPVEGEVASGDHGLGRMAEPEVILAVAERQLLPHPLSGRHIVITAGPTVEDIDPVRYVSNRSSGKMGFALAERAVALGATVTLIAGPVSLPTPQGVQRIDVRGALAMRGAVWQAMHPDLSNADALIMTAAVADYRPAEPKATKMKRGPEGIQVELTPNPDILAEIGHARSGTHPVLVGFALETDTDDRVIAHARTKLANKRVDLVVANRAEEAIGRDDIRIMMVGVRDCDPLPVMAKEDAADRILQWVSTRLQERKR